jgi:hypothetical protein
MTDDRAGALATIAKIRAGLMSRKEGFARTGRRVEDIDEEIAAENPRADRLGLVLDTDQRKVDEKGAGASDFKRVGSEGSQQCKVTFHEQLERAAGQTIPTFFPVELYFLGGSGSREEYIKTVCRMLKAVSARVASSVPVRTDSAIPSRLRS